MIQGIIKPTKEQIARAKPFQAIQQRYRTGASTITDFRNRKTAYFDQKNTMMCRACSMAKQAGFDYWREFGTDLQMSPAFPYGYRVKETYQGEGMDINALYDFVDNGTVPFGDNPLIADYPTCKKSITQAMIANAKKQKGKEVICFFPNRFGWGGFTEDEINILKNYLISGKVIQFAFDFYESFANVRSDGIVPNPAKNETCLASHAMVLEGFRGDGRMIIANSQGEKWGDKGDCYIRWDYPQWMDVWAIEDYVAPVIIQPPPPKPPDPPPPKPPEEKLFIGFRWSYNAKVKKLSIKITDTKGYDYTIRTNGKKTKSKSFSDTKVSPGMIATVYGKDGSKGIIKV